VRSLAKFGDAADVASWDETGVILSVNQPRLTFVWYNNVTPRRTGVGPPIWGVRRCRRSGCRPGAGDVDRARARRRSIAPIRCGSRAIHRQPRWFDGSSSRRDSRNGAASSRRVSLFPAVVPGGRPPAHEVASPICPRQDMEPCSASDDTGRKTCCVPTSGAGSCCVPAHRSPGRRLDAVLAAVNRRGARTRSVCFGYIGDARYARAGSGSAGPSERGDVFRLAHLTRSGHRRSLRRGRAGAQRARGHAGPKPSANALGRGRGGCRSPGSDRSIAASNRPAVLAAPSRAPTRARCDRAAGSDRSSPVYRGRRPLSFARTDAVRENAVIVKTICPSFARVKHEAYSPDSDAPAVVP